MVVVIGLVELLAVYIIVVFVLVMLVNGCSIFLVFYADDDDELDSDGDSDGDSLISSAGCDSEDAIVSEGEGVAVFVGVEGVDGVPGVIDGVIDGVAGIAVVGICLIF